MGNQTGAIPMNTITSTSLISTLTFAALTATTGAQSPEQYLFSLTQNTPNLSTSGGTSLQYLRPNEIHTITLQNTTCSTKSAEKWSPRGAFNTLAGDADGDDIYWDPTMFGAIDAVMAGPLMSPSMPTNLRRVFYSPAVDLAPGVSGPPGLRAGDVGRIIRNTSGDGQVEHFITAEQIQMALGLPPFPIVVNVDACASNPNYGVIFSLEDDHTGLSSACGLTSSTDGDIWMIPPWFFSWTPNMTVTAMTPNSAIRIYSEAEVDLMVFNSRVTDRFGVCQTTIGDTDALEIDLFITPPFLPTCMGPVPIPTLIFAGETLTGGAVLDTVGGGRIRPSVCGNLGTYCTFGPTFGNQLGLQAPSVSVGIAASVNGLSLARSCRFVLESPTPIQAVPAAITIDVASPAPFSWLFVDTAPAGAFAVMPSLPFTLPSGCYPDLHLPAPLFISIVPTPGGFGSYTSPTVSLTGDFVWQAITIVGGSLELSTPVTTELF